MILARAPLRAPLGGGGTDLPSYYSRYGGFILSAAINKYVYICVNRPSADAYIRVKYSSYEQVSSPERIQHDLVRPTLELLEAMAKTLRKRCACRKPGIGMLTQAASDLGLSLPDSYMVGDGLTDVEAG